jgi:sulfur-carrier protein adenylyltransferase/sulfurtransferase
MLSGEELERYNRHLILPEIGLKGQENLKKAKVLVIGAGGLGCPVLQYLTAAGVGTIGICDFDFVDTSNLQRQILYTISDIGKPKANIAAEKLIKINPYVSFVVHNQMLSKDNVLDIFKNYDVIVDGTDNFPTRFLINDASVILNKPLVFGAIYRFEGQVAVFNYKNGPTYRCLVPEEPLQNEIASCAQVGVLGAVPGLIGCYLAIEVIKIICATRNIMSGKMLIIDTLNLNHQIIAIKKNLKAKRIKQLGEYGDFCNDHYNEIKQVNPKELNELILKRMVKVIDIRDNEIYKEYHIKSKNIPLSELLSNPNLIPKNEKIVIICEIGIKSLSVIDTLNKTGNFGELYNLSGGIQAWIKEGLPFAQDKKQN